MAGPRDHDLFTVVHDRAQGLGVIRAGLCVGHRAHDRLQNSLYSILYVQESVQLTRRGRQGKPDSPRSSSTPGAAPRSRASPPSARRSSEGRPQSLAVHGGRRELWVVLVEERLHSNKAVPARAGASGGQRVATRTGPPAVPPLVQPHVGVPGGRPVGRGEPVQERAAQTAQDAVLHGRRVPGDLPHRAHAPPGGGLSVQQARAAPGGRGDGFVVRAGRRNADLLHPPADRGLTAGPPGVRRGRLRQHGDEPLRATGSSKPPLPEVRLRRHQLPVTGFLAAAQHQDGPRLVRVLAVRVEPEGAGPAVPQGCVESAGVLKVRHVFRSPGPQHQTGVRVVVGRPDRAVPPVGPAVRRGQETPSNSSRTAPAARSPSQAESSARSSRQES